MKKVKTWSGSRKKRVGPPSGALLVWKIKMKILKGEQLLLKAVSAAKPQTYCPCHVGASVFL